MEREAERVAVDEYELDRQAWSLPRPLKWPQTSQAPFSVQSRREDKAEPEREAA